MNDSIYIVGGGTSLKDFDFSILENKKTLCVNKSIFHVPNPKMFITMDYSFLNEIERKELKKINCPKTFILNIHSGRIDDKDGAIIDNKVGTVYKLDDFDIIIKSYKDTPIGFDWKNFCHGYHSGFCALQYAVLMGYKNIYLLGFDYKVEGERSHYHEEYIKRDDFRRNCSKFLHSISEGLRHIIIRDNINVYRTSEESQLKGLEYREVR